MKLVLSTPPIIGVGWACDVLDNSLEYEQGQIFTPVPQNPFDLNICLVAEPIRWLESAWMHSQYLHPHRPEIESLRKMRELKAPSFEQFVIQYLIHMPGSLEQIIAEYNPNICLRMEDMPQALEQLIESTGHVYTPSFIPRPKLGIPIISENLRRRIYYKEQDYVSRFDYR